MVSAPRTLSYPCAERVAQAPFKMTWRSMSVEDALGTGQHAWDAEETVLVFS